MAISAKPLEFSAEEIGALRRVISRELERMEEEKRERQRIDAHLEKQKAERDETERMQRLAREIPISHNMLRDGVGCVCAECMKKRASAPLSFVKNV